MLDSEKLKTFLETTINPRVQGDGGEITFMGLEGSELSIRVQGECSRCPLTHGCFKEWMVKEIKQVLGEEITVKIEVKKPYFWDK